MSTRWVYPWGELAAAEKDCGGVWDEVRGLMGGKGANLARMASLELPVPPGFTITTVCCNAYQSAKALPDGTWEQVLAALKGVEAATGKTFGGDKPLLVSCRSGAKFSMPGMMDTVLNLGLNDKTAAALAAVDGVSARFVFDAYRRLVQGFGAVVLGIKDEEFEKPLAAYKADKGYASDTDMTADDWKALLAQFKTIIADKSGRPFPDDVYEQLRMSVCAVFDSWGSARAFAYRRATGISDTLGTACNIQTMVFGNMGSDSATGVGFTRDPATGENVFYGEYLTNAQGEDVVAGIRNTSKIADLEKEYPQAFKDLMDCGAKLEEFFSNMQDIEFTIENKKLYMLQTRDGKRTAQSAVRIAVEMVDEGRINKREAVKRISPKDIASLLHPMFPPAEIKKAQADGKLLAKGVNASPGAAVGQVVFDANRAEEWAKEGKTVILCRPFTKPDDVHGFLASAGILTAEGGATSHAAVVARQLGIVCVSSAAALHIDLEKRQFTVEGLPGVVVKEGDVISVDGTGGAAYAGKIPSVASKFEDQPHLRTILEWADDISAEAGQRASLGSHMPSKGLGVLANADYGVDAAKARSFGARGVGLCRTEHMFFESDRLPIVQKMILATTEEARKVELDKLLPMQRSDFYDILKAMDGLPVTIRLIDPPLHEFLPHYEDLIAEVARLEATPGTDAAVLAERQALLKSVAEMHESNPMMGLRGVRLSIVMPAIVEMQVRALFEAACNLLNEGLHPLPRVMIPLTDTVNEILAIQPQLERIAGEVFEAKGCKCEYQFGTMIETPRACLVAGSLAGAAQFFSVGSNDLTQMTFGFSRDDAERKFLLKYVESKILPANPFQTIDEDGVGRLIRMAVAEGHEKRPDISVGICGEHGGDPESIGMAYRFGLDYVSCSPFRVPVARLAAAHAAIKGL